MNSEMINTILSLLGSCIGTFSGIIAASRLTAYRIAQLEKKVDKHNNFASRIPVAEEQIKEIQHRINRVERRIENDE